MPTIQHDPQDRSPQDRSMPQNRPSAEPALFAMPPVERRRVPLAVWPVAGIIVLLLLSALVDDSRHTSTHTSSARTAIQPLDAKAATLAVTGIVMSESTSLSGGKSTYIDGHIQNHGTATVTAITVQVLFANDAGSAPQIETTPLTLIRTRQPYVDVEPVSAEPLKPGEDREFRLIFEAISPSWNQQIPEIRLTHITAR